MDLEVLLRLETLYVFLAGILLGGLVAWLRGKSALLKLHHEWESRLNQVKNEYDGLFERFKNLEGKSELALSQQKTDRDKLVQTRAELLKLKSELTEQSSLLTTHQNDMLVMETELSIYKSSQEKYEKLKKRWDEDHSLMSLFRNRLRESEGEKAELAKKLETMNGQGPKNGNGHEKEEKDPYGINWKRIGKATRRDKDDLTKVKGIGPSNAKRLNRIGIYTYEQIAKMKAADEEAVSVAINYFVERFRRDKWIDSAKELFAQKKKEEAELQQEWVKETQKKKK